MGGIDKQAVNLLQNLLLVEPQKRMDIKDIVCHKFFPLIPAFSVLQGMCDLSSQLHKLLISFGCDLHEVVEKAKSFVLDETATLYHLWT